MNECKYDWSKKCDYYSIERERDLLRIDADFYNACYHVELNNLRTLRNKIKEWENHLSQVPPGTLFHTIRNEMREVLKDGEK